jgi:hypothetical protein
LSFLSRWFPTPCSRLRVFICYAREDRALAREIGQTLTNDGHDVFIDANSLSVATDFNEVIRRAIDRADRFVFLISRHSMENAAYPQTELGFAEKRWPSPKGTVWPVIIDQSIDPGSLPPYLRSVQVHTPKGNIVADLAAAIEASKTLRPSCVIAATGVAALATGLGILAATGGIKPASFALLAPQQVDFRPAKKPGPGTDWMDARLALTLVPVNYVNESSTPVRILDETVNLTLGDKTIPFKWHNEVELRSNCGDDWLCTKTSVGAATMGSQLSLKRETMYVPATGSDLSWKRFVNYVCNSSAETFDVTLQASTSASNMLGATPQTRTTKCRVDLKTMRENLQQKGCKTDTERLPLRLSPKCLE